MGISLSRIASKLKLPHGAHKPAIKVLSLSSDSTTPIIKCQKHSLVPRATINREQFTILPAVCDPPPRTVKSNPKPILFGDHDSEVESIALESTRIQLAGDSISGSLLHPDKCSPPFKPEPLTYQLRLKLLESEMTRLMFLDLYDLDLQSLSEEEFIHWCEKAEMPQTMTMYKAFKQDATNYATKRHLTALENRFDIQVTLGDCLPLYEFNSVSTKSQHFSPGRLGRDLTIYGKLQSRIVAAVNYLGAILNQLQRDQLILPNSHLFALSTEVSLHKWILPRAPGSESRLLQLRRHATRPSLTGPY
ncbi:unnamed protein product [Echinostoma caproni]|uniref:RGS domain-containing protein n=1 Tax=Echinostoma caproni TaxID=27848 RepID=A0A183ACJ3_9TREM|nr:unnamed protein product [Echinostoma caproni]